VNIMETLSEPVLAIMSRPVVAIDADAKVSKVLQLAAREHIHHFPIVERGALVGFVCTCDLEDARADAVVSSFSKRDVVTIPSYETAENAARLMRERAVGSVVVTGAGGICGIVTREDVARYPELASLLEEGRCAACGARAHLRPGPDGAFLCSDCGARARGDNWFDLGAGD
jgi:predicted transcriptional regulator